MAIFLVDTGSYGDPPGTGEGWETNFEDGDEDGNRDGILSPKLSEAWMWKVLLAPPRPRPHIYMYIYV